MLNTPLKQQTNTELRKFGLVTGAIVVVLFGLLLPWIFSHKLPLWPWIIAGVLWVWALIMPSSLSFVYKGWMAVGHVLGWINTRIILGIMFFILFLPAGIILKLLGKDPMARKLDKSLNSYRVTHKRPDRNHVEKPY